MTYEEIIAEAKAVLERRSRSYVKAAEVLAKWILAHPLPMPARRLHKWKMMTPPVSKRTKFGVIERSECIVCGGTRERCKVRVFKGKRATSEFKLGYETKYTVAGIVSFGRVAPCAAILPHGEHRTSDMRVAAQEAERGDEAVREEAPLPSAREASDVSDADDSSQR